MRSTNTLHSSIKKLLGYTERTASKSILADWNTRTSRVCKPCWELKYCPYGPLVEDFPLPPPTRAEAEQHNEYLKKCLETGYLADGKQVDADRKKRFEEHVREFDARRYPHSYPQVILDASCRVFGHMCPVFFMSEPLTETKDLRKHTRRVPRDVMFKVVRRDGQICQKCFQPVPDDQIEFDHMIPYAKGGATTADNLRLMCRDCNREKSDSLDDPLSPYPIEHFLKIRNRKRR